MAMRRRWQAAAVVLALAAALGLALSEAEAQKVKGKTRPAATKQLMKGVVQPNCGALAAAFKKGPADDKAWDTVSQQAAVLNEMSYVIMDDGRCPDKDWADAAKALREASAKVLAASKEKSADEAKAAFKGVTDACAACHKVHKK
jgi:cytochrome c556